MESLEDWDFEELPDGWSVCCLGELCDYGNCTNIDTADIADSAWILDLEDIEMLEDLVMLAFNNAQQTCRTESEAAMNKAVPLPAGMKLPF